MWTKLVSTQTKLRTTLVAQYKQGALANACAKMVGLPPPSTMSINDDVLGQSMFNALKTTEVGTDIFQDIDRVVDGVLIGQEMHAAGATPIEIMWSVLPNIWYAGTSILSAGFLIDKIKNHWYGQVSDSEYVAWFTDTNKTKFERVCGTLGITFNSGHVATGFDRLLNNAIPELVNLRIEKTTRDQDLTNAVEFLNGRYNSQQQKIDILKFASLLNSNEVDDQNLLAGLFQQLGFKPKEGRLVPIMTYWLKETIRTFGVLANRAYQFQPSKLDNILKHDRVTTRAIAELLSNIPVLNQSFQMDHQLRLFHYTNSENALLRWLITQVEERECS